MMHLTLTHGGFLYLSSNNKKKKDQNVLLISQAEKSILSLSHEIEQEEIRLKKKHNNWSDEKKYFFL